MKKITGIILLLLWCVCGLFANDKEIPENLQQRPVEVVSPHSDLEIQAKRCTMNGNTAVIEFVITNLSSKDINMSFYGGYDSYMSNRSVAYDDEGNKYPVKLGVSGTNRFVNERLRDVSFPSEVPVKIIMQVPDMDKSATYFSRINLNFYSDDLGLIQNDAAKNNFRIKNLVIQGR